MSARLLSDWWARGPRLCPYSWEYRGRKLAANAYAASAANRRMDWDVGRSGGFLNYFRCWRFHRKIVQARCRARCYCQMLKQWCP